MVNENDERIAKMSPLLRDVLILLGEDPEREGLRNTPERWAEALLTYTEGNLHNAQEHRDVIFTLDEDASPAQTDDMIIVDNIEFASTCEHHIAPFRGLVHIAYIPNPESRVVTGLSKLSRVVSVFCKRLQLQ